MLFDNDLVRLVFWTAITIMVANGCAPADVTPIGAPLIEGEVGFVDDYSDLVDDCLDGYVACAVLGGDASACVGPLRDCVDAGDPLLEMGVTCPADPDGALAAKSDDEGDVGEDDVGEDDVGEDVGADVGAEAGHETRTRPDPRECPDDDDDPPPPVECDEPDELIDFSSLTAGEIVDAQISGLTFTCRNDERAHPDACLAFDTSAPTGGDDDLGTPHADFGGPGRGEGGAAGAEGENARALGVAVIIAEDLEDADADGLVDDPDDEARGGSLTIDFERPRAVRSLTVLDIDSSERAEIRYTTLDGTVRRVRLARPGNNSVQVVAIEAADVVRIELRLPNSGALAQLTLGPICDPPEPCRPGLDRPAIGLEVDACIDTLASCVTMTPDFAECVNDARPCVSRSLRGPLLPLCLSELAFCRSSGRPEDECLAIQMHCDALGAP